MNEQAIRQLYYDPSQGYTSELRLLRKVRETNPRITLKEVRDFLERQFTFQVTRQHRRPRRFPTIVANFPRDCYQMDIMVYDRYEINQYKYVLVVIDVYSRYVTAVALTNMREETLLDKIRSIFTSMGTPQNLNCDQQFVSAQLRRFFNEQGVTVYASEVDELYKNAIVERFNRTLALMLQRWRVSVREKRWYQVLPLLIDNYNNTFHRTIKATPNQVWNLEKGNNQEVVTVRSRLSVSDQVRTRTVKKSLTKGDTLRYSQDLYAIVDKQGARFVLRNLRTQVVPKRTYKESELRRITSVEFNAEADEENLRDVEAGPRRPNQRRAMREIESTLEEAPLPSRRVRRPSARVLEG